MNKSLLIAILAMTFAGNAFAAADRTGAVDLGMQVAYVSPSEDDDLDSGVYYGGTFAYGMNSWLAIGAEAGRFEMDDDSVQAAGFSGGEVTGVPVLFDVLLRFSEVHPSVDPYLIGGVGAIFWDVDEVTGTVAGIPVTVETDVDTAFAAKLGGGIDWFITENWILNFEASYVFTSADAEATVTGGGVTATALASDIELDYWTVGGGFKYKF